MSIVLNEYCNFVPLADNGKRSFQFQESEFKNDYTVPENTLMVEVEGIHAYPYQTRNFTRYMPQALKKSAKKWTHPYLLPLIKHHNDKDGHIIGRIYDATYTEQTSVEGVGGLVFTVSVPDEKDAKEVEDRRLETVSIGVSANDVRCSICGEQILDPNEGCPNGHDRGQEYDDKVCCWDIYDIEPKELSYVIVPSDMFAKNKRVYRANAPKAIPTTKITEAAEDELQKKHGGNNPPMDLKDKLEEAQKKIAELQGLLDASKEELETMTADKEKLEKEKEELTTEKEKLEETLNAVKETVKDTETKLENTKEELETTKAEKEESDKSGIAAKEEVRKLTEASIALYRKILGKAELTEEEIKSRSLESLNDSLKDYKEEYDDSLKDIERVPNPLRANFKEEKEEKTNKEVNLKEGLNDLFYGLF